MSQPPAGGPPLSPMALMDTAWSFTRTEVLKTGVELGIFTEIDNGQRTAPALARATGADERATRILLNALAGLKIVEKSGDEYTLPDSSRVFLSRNSPAYLGEFLLHVNQIMPAWSHLTEVVKTGKPYTRVESEDDRGDFFSKLVSGLFSMGWAGAQAAAKALVPGRNGIHVLDIGAGSGVWGIAFAHQDPQARVTVADFPAVIEVTRKFVAQHGMTGRFDYLPGNFREAPFGEHKYDFAILGHIVHSEGERNARTMFRRIQRALKPGGKLVIAEFLADEPRREATFPLLFAVNMLVHTEEGDTYTLPEISRWLKEAGFAAVDTLPGPTPSPLIVATAATTKAGGTAG